MMAELPTTTVAPLLDPCEMASLDAKIAAAVSKIASGEVGRKVTLQVEDYAKQGIMMTGRLMLRVVYDEFKLDEERGIAAGYADLAAVKSKGAKHLGQFFSNWEHVESLLVEPTDGDIEEIMFYDEAKTSQRFAAEIAH